MGRHKGCLGLRGEKHPNSKLSNADRRYARELAALGNKPAQIAILMNVSVTTIRNIITSEFTYDD